MVPHANSQILSVAYNDYYNNRHFDDLLVQMDYLMLFLNSMMKNFEIQHIHIVYHYPDSVLMVQPQNSFPPIPRYQNIHYNP